jgi:hypothetical protein
LAGQPEGSYPGREKNLTLKSVSGDLRLRPGRSNGRARGERAPVRARASISAFQGRNVA